MIKCDQLQLIAFTMSNTFGSIIPLGVRYMMLSALGFALMTACVKYVSNYGIPVFEIVAARAFVSLIISYLDVKRKKYRCGGEIINHYCLLEVRSALWR